MKFKQLFPFTLIALLAVVGFSSCGDDDEAPEGKANVGLQFDFTVDGQAFVANDVYMINGVNVSFEIASFYVSGVTFTPDAGDAISVDKHILVSPTTTSDAIIELDKGAYPTVKFDVGVQADANDQTEEDFTSRSTDDPLSMQQPSMHWNWSAGYKFIRLDGLSDVDGDGTPETPIAYHLGTANFLSTISKSVSTEFTADNTDLVFEVDIAKLLTDFDLTTDLDTHTANNIPLAEKFAANIPTAFTVK